MEDGWMRQRQRCVYEEAFSPLFLEGGTYPLGELVSRVEAEGLEALKPAWCFDDVSPG